MDFKPVKIIVIYYRLFPRVYWYCFHVGSFKIQQSSWSLDLVFGLRCFTIVSSSTCTLSSMTQRQALQTPRIGSTVVHRSIDVFRSISFWMSLAAFRVK